MGASDQGCDRFAFRGWCHALEVRISSCRHQLRHCRIKAPAFVPRENQGGPPSFSTDRAFVCMVLLRLPRDVEGDDVDCDDWEDAVRIQIECGLDTFQPGTLEEGDALAMLDRSCFTADFSRRVFVLVYNEDSVYIFDEHGQIIDEPGDFTPGGRQPFNDGDGHSFIEEWTGTPDDFGRTGAPRLGLNKGL
jgi:hypothetical protein|eukprot:3778254-Prymnesium_polylepis.1